MERERLDKTLDEWLDRASTEFGRAEPDTEFEARIAVALHERTARRRLWFRWRALAAGATAVTVILFLAFLTHFTDRPEKHVASNQPGGSKTGLELNHNSAATSAADVVKPRIARRSEVVVSKQMRESLPRQNVFPSVRLSNQERLLLRCARSLSAGKIVGFLEDDEYRPVEFTKVEIPITEISELVIEPIRIEPLP
jgi:hypothetical protein